MLRCESTLGPLSGRVDFGIVSIGMTLMTIVATVVLAGLHTGVGRYIPRSDTPRERNGVIISALHIVIPLSVVAAVVLAVFSTPLAEALLNDQKLRWVIIAFAVGVPFNTVVRFANGTIQGSQEVLPRVYLQNIGIPGARFVFLGIAVLFGLGLSGVVAATVGAYVALSGYALWVISRSLSSIRTTGYDPAHRELLSFSIPLLITSAMLLVFSEIDTLMLGYFASSGTVGDYKVVYPLAMLLLIVLRSFQFLFMPQISERHADDDLAGAVEAYASVTKWVFVATVPVFLVLISAPKQIIILLFGAEYTGGTLALIVLCVGFVTHTAVGPNGTTLTSIGRTRTIMYDNIVVAAINVILNFLLIPRYGILGAAIATAVAYVGINILYSAQLFRALGILPFPGSAIRLYLFSLISAAAVLWTWFIDAATVRLIVAAVALLLFPVAVVRLGGISVREVELLEQVGQRIGLSDGRLTEILDRFVDD
ncbi:flippase [Halobaculum halobium]|uniref:flippase n=1 Tax=Halobaculum halobium TaxID=3032281 RepID=UPI0036061596